MFQFSKLGKSLHQNSTMTSQPLLIAIFVIKKHKFKHHMILLFEITASESNQKKFTFTVLITIFRKAPVQLKSTHRFFHLNIGENREELKKSGEFDALRFGISFVYKSVPFQSQVLHVFLHCSLFGVFIFVFIFFLSISLILVCVCISFFLFILYSPIDIIIVMI